MHRILSKTLILLCTFLLLVTCVSCKEEEVYTNLMWLEDLASKANLESEDQNDYFTFSNEQNRAYLNALVAWSVISKDDNIPPNNHLQKQFVAYTLNNLIGSNNKVIESTNDTYGYIEDVVDLGIMSLDEKGNFNPQAKVNKEEAHKYIDKALEIINNRQFEEESEIEFTQDTAYIDSLPPKVNNTYPITEDYPIGSYIYDKSENKIYKIDSKSENGYTLSEVSFEEAIQEAKFSGTIQDLDFSEAEVEIYGEEVDESSIYNQEGIQRIANFKSSNVFEIDGYRISYSLSLNKIHLRVSKKTKNGLNVYFDGDVYGVSPSYKWDYSKGNINEAYLKVNFKTTEELGLSKGKYNILYGDFDSLKGEKLFDRLKNFLKPKEDLIETSFTIMKIKVPIPNVPIATFDTELKLNIYLSGKVELVLASEHGVGLEIRNNSLRIISDHDADLDLNINATSSATLSLIFSLNLIKDLVDVRFNGGIKALAEATLHVYDSKGRVSSQRVDGEYDALSELADRDEVYVCADLSLFWVLNIEFNSSRTLAHTLGLSKKLNILDEDNQVFNNLHHLEKGMFVKECSYKKNRSWNTHDTLVLTSDQITLDTYSIVLKDKAAIPIKAMPSGYTIKDLLYECEDKAIVKVDNEGYLYPIKGGVTKVRIYTRDEKYEVFINVLVSNDEVVCLFI